MVSYIKHSFKSMASSVKIEAELDEANATKVFQEIESTFSAIASSATRFDNSSELMQLNKKLNTSVEISPLLLELIQHAYDAYKITNGMFEPRILKALISAGYVNTFHDNEWVDLKVRPMIIKDEWKPEFTKTTVNIGRDTIDLGGIGKSFAVVKASEIMKQYSSNFYINAGGDALFCGVMPNGEDWTVGVENPFDISLDYPTVLHLSNLAVATSSKAKHHWDDDNRKWHHIIDPSTGLPSESGIRAVTVIHENPMNAEIWSKSLMLHKHNELSAKALENNIPALWFTEDGYMHHNQSMKPFIIS